MDGLVAVLAVGGVLVVAFLVLLLGRELVAWYLKVNESLERLERLEAVLRNIDKNISTMTDNSELAAGAKE